VKDLADEVRELPIDLIVEGSERKYAVERKTVLEFWSSVKDGRLWKQLHVLEEMRNDGYIPLLVVVGSWAKLFKVAEKMTPINFIGMQVGLGSFGVTVVNLPKQEWFLLLVKYLEAKAGQKKTFSRPNIPKPVTRTLLEEKVDVLRAIDGIGEKTAMKLLERFGSIKNVMNAESQDLEEILKSRLSHFLEVIG
jgi:ERCC4-type nuclease